MTMMSCRLNGILYSKNNGDTNNIPTAGAKQRNKPKPMMKRNLNVFKTTTSEQSAAGEQAIEHLSRVVLESKEPLPPTLLLFLDFGWGGSLRLRLSFHINVDFMLFVPL